MAEAMPDIKAELAAGRSVGVYPRGVSMMPMIRQGRDAVELSPLPEQLEKYDLPLYQRDDGQYVLHRIVKAGKTYTCMGDNQFKPEHSVRMDQMIAVTTALLRDGKRIDVACWQYRFYCRFWHFTRPVRHFYRWCKNGMKVRLKRLFK